MAWGSPGRRRQRKILNPIMPIMPLTPLLPHMPIVATSLLTIFTHRVHMVGARPVVSRQSPDELTHNSASVAPSQDRQQPVVATRSGLWPFCPHMPSGLMSGLGPLWLIPDGGWKYCALFSFNILDQCGHCPHILPSHALRSDVGSWATVVDS